MKWFFYLICKENIEDNFKINPLKGEYQLFVKQWGNLVNHILLPIPTKLSKGILVAPTVNHNLLIGPNSYRVKEKEDPATTNAGIKEVCEGARKLIPHLPHQDLVASFAGLRADIEGRDDFIINASKKIRGFINVVGIESPGLSSVPVIAGGLLSDKNEIEKLFQKEVLAVSTSRKESW